MYIYTRIYIYIIHTHTMEYYPVLKRNEILIFTTWMNLEGIIQSDISQAEKDKYHMISLI